MGPTSSPRVVRLATRGSPLARWQTEHVAQLIRERHPDVEVEPVVESSVLFAMVIYGIIGLAAHDLVEWIGRPRRD